MPRGKVPGFIALYFDIPFPVSVHDNDYFVRDPIGGAAIITLKLREGSRAFYKNSQMAGGPSSERNHESAVNSANDQAHEYLITAKLRNGDEKPVFGVTSGPDGGFAESKYYSEVRVIFLADDINLDKIGEKAAFRRACDILNPFLRVYSLVSGDYRVSEIAYERGFYFAMYHVSPLEKRELGISSDELFRGFDLGRKFLGGTGGGAANILFWNSWELVGPWQTLNLPTMKFFLDLIERDYVVPLSYSLLLDEIRTLRRNGDFRIAIIHAETAFEVYVRGILLDLLMHFGKSQIEADEELDEGPAFWGVTKRVKQLDILTERYCNEISHGFIAFVGSSLYKRWKSDLYHLRNSTVHAGAAGFTFEQASAALDVTLQSIPFFESRVPGLRPGIVIDASMSNYQGNIGEILF